MTNSPASETRRKGAWAIGRIAAEVTRGAFERHGLGGGEIAHAWPHLVGPELARVSRPERIAPPAKGRRGGGTLHVVAAGAHGVEIHYAAPRIVAGVNALYGREVISAVKVRAGEGIARPEAAAPGPSPRPDAGHFTAIRRAPLREALARLEAGILADEAARLAPARGDAGDGRP